MKKSILIFLSIIMSLNVFSVSIKSIGVDFFNLFVFNIYNEYIFDIDENIDLSLKNYFGISPEYHMGLGLKFIYMDPIKINYFLEIRSRIYDNIKAKIDNNILAGLNYDISINQLQKLLNIENKNEIMEHLLISPSIGIKLYEINKYKLFFDLNLKYEFWLSFNRKINLKG